MNFIPTRPLEEIAREYVDSGNVGMHDDGFHLDPPTQFEYSQTNRNDYDNDDE